MNVQGRRRGISCDNKGERLIHKKKKWLVAGTATEQRRGPPCGDHSDPKPTTSGAGPRSPASAAPPTGNASGGGGRKPNPIPRPRGWREPHLGPRLGNGPDAPEGGGSPRRAAGHPGAPPAERPEHCSPRARGPGTHACACAHTHSHTDTYIYTHTHSHTHTGPQHIAPHAPARPCSTRLGSAPERPGSRGGAYPEPKSACTHAHTRRGTPPAAPARRPA